MAAHIDQVNVLAELERCGVVYHWAGESEDKTTCPFHDDESPSCHVNVEKRLFKCQAASCGKHGDIVTFLAQLLATTRAVVLADLGTRYLIEDTKIVDMDVVERWHLSIWGAKHFLNELYARAVTDEDIRKYRLGFNGKRVTIPIKNATGDVVNVRGYLPGAPGSEKMKNMKGRGKPRLFPEEQMKYDRVVVCGGELKAIVAARELNPRGIGAVCATCGEGNWESEFTPRFKGKQAWVMLDVDEGGRVGAKNLCTALRFAADWVGDVLLPLDIDKFPHGDVNDFVANGGDLWTVVNLAEEWHPAAHSLDVESAPLEVSLSAAIKADLAGKRVSVACVVSAMDTAPYVIPKDCVVDCDRSAKVCFMCPVAQCDTNEFTLHPEPPAILEMAHSSSDVQRGALMKAFGVPANCRVCDVKAKTFYNVEDARVSPELDIVSQSAEDIRQVAYCVGDGLELNEHYRCEGRMYPHPKAQQSTLLISKYAPTKDALSTYSADDTGALRAFQPAEWTVDGIRDKLNSLYGDFEANVTRVYQRRQMHLTIDLAYHSPLFITFDGQRVKGWVEVLVMGDSSQGKSEATNNLMNHYQLGCKFDCKNASVAGILGGVQQLGTRWMVEWGIVPKQDRRLVVFEELKGASTEIIGKLTDMRSSGVAEIPKIIKRRALARTRIIALSNPRSDRPLKTYNFGVTAIKELIGNLEDVRRFDMALLVASHEVNASELNRLTRDRPKAEHVHPAELCRALVLWAWTREPQQVQFSRDSVPAVLDLSTTLCEEYTDAIPIVDRGSMRYKVARLAAALAARTFSSEGRVLEVLVPHVGFVAQMLRKTYSTSTFGYKDFTEAITATDTVQDPDVLRKRINETPFPLDFVKHMLHANWVDLYDIQDWCGWDRVDAMELLSLFARKYALPREGRKYMKSSQFIELLKAMLESGEIPERPAFLEMGEF